MGCVWKIAGAAGDVQGGAIDGRDGAVPQPGRLFASLLERSLARSLCGLRSNASALDQTSCASRSTAKWRYNLVAASVVVADQAARQFVVGLCRRPFPSWKMPISSGARTRKRPHNPRTPWHRHVRRDDRRLETWSRRRRPAASHRHGPDSVTCARGATAARRVRQSTYCNG